MNQIITAVIVTILVGGSMYWKLEEANPKLQYTELEVIFDGENELQLKPARIYPEKCSQVSA